MEKEFIKKIEKELKQKKTKIEKELLEFAQKSVHNKNNYRTKFPNIGDEAEENAKEIDEFSTNLGLKKILEKDLRDIKDALKRIKDGTYGKCKYCGKEISKERLLARPVSSACIECKRKLQK